MASNVHFPTDMNLLWDSIHKSLSLLNKLQSKVKMGGWRKSKYIERKLKASYRETSEIHRKKGGNYQERLKVSASNYLILSKKVSEKIKKSMIEAAAKTTENIDKQLDELACYVSMLDLHVDLLERRVIKGETIPHSEKIFSIYERHVEWLSKGKLNMPVTIGHNVVITTDQYQFIVDYAVYEKTTDKTAANSIGERIAAHYGSEYDLESLSFDRGFYSILVKKALEKIFRKVIMPKPGKKGEAIELEESEAAYKKIRKQHSAVESNINELQQSGLKKVMDKGIEGFKRYVSFAVLSMNIKRLGKILLDEKRAEVNRDILKKVA